MEGGDQPCPSPSPNPNSSFLFRDISNFKTPKRHFKHPSTFPLQSPYPQFFTASKQTPSSCFSSSSSSAVRRRPSVASSLSRSKAARRLKAFELEQTQSSRKAQLRKEKSLNCLAKALSVWLNFLFENPRSCGCNLGGLNEVEGVEDLGPILRNGKRDSLTGGNVGVGIDGPWRYPKRPRDCFWKPEGDSGVEPLVLSSTAFSALRVSLNEVCSFEDLKQRMRGYLSSESCREVLSVMSQVAKNIDDGRLKMKAHCPIVTDVGMKEKAIKVIMSYNPVWLRIGLYIVFGGDSLLPTGDGNSDKELVFLKMVVEKLLFSHEGLAKAFAYNKLVEGLYRPGYFEALGNVILKRVLLLVLILDRAKSQSSLPLKYGIDGTDGGSPLLFRQETKIKSSGQVIQDFLTSEVMHGEGNLLAHLVIVGYKVSYQQYSLLEYDFRVTDLFQDLQDGIRLCRAIQLLLCDTSILMKIVFPSDTPKKNLANCRIAMEYLKQVQMPLSDEDGTVIVAEDISSGEKELVISLLWNLFIHVQLPLLINKTLLFEEICKVNGVEGNQMCDSFSHLEMLLELVKTISLKYDVQVDSTVSLVDGKALWCMIDYYFRNEICCSCCNQKTQCSNAEESNLWVTDCSDAVHNFVLSMKLTTILGNFPEVLQTSDILEYNGACNERSVIILLVFLSSQLIGRKNMLNIHKFLGCNCKTPEMKRLSLHKCVLNTGGPTNPDGLDGFSNEDTVTRFKVIQAWWRDLTKRNLNCQIQLANTSEYCLSTKRLSNTNTQRERAANIIQSHFRGLIERRKFLKMKFSASFLQAVIRLWLMVKNRRDANKFSITNSTDVSGRYLKFIVERHTFLSVRKSVLLIQKAVRAWIIQRHQGDWKIKKVSAHANLVTAATVIQSYARRWIAKSRYFNMVSQQRKNSIICAEKKVLDLQIEENFNIQTALKDYKKCNCSSECTAATKIQSHWRCWLMRNKFLHQKNAILKIQSGIRCVQHQRAFQHYKIAVRSAVIIQCHVRGMICRRKARRERLSIVMIQSHWRGWVTRREFLCKRVAAIKIQSYLRCFKCWNSFQSYRRASIEIQRFARGQISRKRLLGAAFHGLVTCHAQKAHAWRGCHQSLELKFLLHSVLKIQRWWKRVLLLKARTRSAITIQSYVRGWLTRQEACREKHRIVVVQSYWRGYLARKDLRGQLLDLRLRVQKTAANVDDGMRLINRLVSALSELLSTRSVSSILHTCATLDVATEHSQKCCETLVDAGAIETLLKLIRSVSRSIPDQEILKHALSTLRNLAHYPHLADELIDTNGSLEIVFWEYLRNKEEGFFVASELLKKLCSTEKGVKIICNLPSLVKRLHNLVDDLTRKVSIDKRKPRSLQAKEHTERRLKEAVELLRLVTNG